MQQNDTATAQQYCSQLMQSDQNSTDATLIYARIMAQQGNFTDAMIALKTSLERVIDYEVLALWMDMRWRSGPGWAADISSVFAKLERDSAPGLLYCRGVFAKYFS